MKSATIVQFPIHNRNTSVSGCSSGNRVNTRKSPKQAGLTGWQRLMRWAIGIAWLLLGLAWPLLNRIATLDVLFQWVNVIVYSNIPATHAALQATLHTAVYLFLSAFIYLYRPKNI